MLCSCLRETDSGSLRIASRPSDSRRPHKLTPGNPMRNPRIHHEYRIEFYDHCSNSDEPVVCVVWGRLAKMDARYLVIDTWGHLDPNHARVHGDDVECFCLLRSAIINMFECEGWKSL